MQLITAVCANEALSAAHVQREHVARRTRVVRGRLKKEGTLALGHRGRLPRTWTGRRQNAAEESGTDTQNTKECLRSVRLVCPGLGWALVFVSIAQEARSL